MINKKDKTEDKKIDEDISQNEDLIEKKVKSGLDNYQNSQKMPKNSKHNLDLNKNEKVLNKTSKRKTVNKENEKKETINYDEELSRLREEKLRLLAEMENFRKRVEKEKI